MSGRAGTFGVRELDWRGVALRLLPAALLVVVACTQIALARRAALSPWLGGGFGMFSSTDAWGRRHLHVYALRPGLRRELAIPPSARRAALDAAALPTQGHLRALARGLAELPSPDEGPLLAIELQVWGVRFDRETLEPAGVLVRSLEVPFDAR